MDNPHKSPHKMEGTNIGTVAGAVELIQPADGTACCLFFYMSFDRADKAGGSDREKVQIWESVSWSRDKLSALSTAIRTGDLVEVRGNRRSFHQTFTLENGKKKIVPVWFIEAIKITVLSRNQT